MKSVSQKGQLLFQQQLDLFFQEDEQLLSAVREVQCLVCSRLHQMFIADPNLAKLVHFQVSRPSAQITYNRVSGSDLSFAAVKKSLKHRWLRDLNADKHPW